MLVADKKSPAAEESCSPPLSPSASFTRSYTGPGPLNTAANTSNNNINTTTTNSSSSLDNKETAPSKFRIAVVTMLCSASPTQLS